MPGKSGRLTGYSADFSDPAPAARVTDTPAGNRPRPATPHTDAMRAEMADAAQRRSEMAKAAVGVQRGKRAAKAAGAEAKATVAKGTKIAADAARAGVKRAGRLFGRK